MAAFHFLLRTLAAATLLAAALYATPSVADGTQVIFDLPDSIECRDVTPKEFAASYPARKIIEAKVRISVRIAQGSEQDLVDLRYFITSPGKTLTFRDYLPNTTLESTVVDDHIEIAKTTEKSAGTTADAHVTEHILGLGGSTNQSSKTTEATHYKEIAPKTLILSSGTTDREHGVFFKIRPSKGASLEGAEEFTFRATVPKAWSGDWCTISCAARAKKKSLFSTTVVPAGGEMTDIGLFLAGDAKACALAKELYKTQDACAAVLATPAGEKDPLEKVFGAVSTEYKSVAGGIFKSKKSQQEKLGEDDKADSERHCVEDAETAVSDVKERLRHLAE